MTGHCLLFISKYAFSTFLWARWRRFDCSIPKLTSYKSGCYTILISILKVCVLSIFWSYLSWKIFLSLFLRNVLILTCILIFVKTKKIYIFVKTKIRFFEVEGCLIGYHLKLRELFDNWISVLVVTLCSHLVNVYMCTSVKTETGNIGFPARLNAKCASNDFTGWYISFCHFYSFYVDLFHGRLCFWVQIDSNPADNRIGVYMLLSYCRHSGSEQPLAACVHL